MKAEDVANEIVSESPVDTASLKVIMIKHLQRFGQSIRNEDVLEFRKRHPCICGVEQYPEELGDHNKFCPITTIKAIESKKVE